MRAISPLAGLWVVGLLLAPAPDSAASECRTAGGTAIAELRSGTVPEGLRVTVEGTVTGVFAGRERLGGFFLQQEGTPPTGIFVYAPELAPAQANPGHRVQVDGRFTRFHERPQIHRVSALRDCGRVGLPDPVPLRLPEDAARLDRLQDVKVRFVQELTVTGNRELHRHGTLRLSANGRRVHPGQTGTAVVRDRDAHEILLDDGSHRLNPDPIPHLDARGTRRTGDTVTDLTGILAFAFGDHRVHPTRPPGLTSTTRPAPPAKDSGTLRVAALNAENWFVSLGQRGAGSRAQRQRQIEKLGAMILGLDADVLSLSEIENRPEALAMLLEHLNAGLSAEGRYAAVTHPAPGRDAIQVAILYRSARLTLAGAEADTDRVHNRPPLLAWLYPLGHPDHVFGVAAVHFKAKTGCPDQGDIDTGEGCWNQLRSAQARRLAEWIERLRRLGAPVIVAGDLNAYAAETPAASLRSAGKIDLAALYHPRESLYTYVYQGQAGQLDFLLAPRELAVRTHASGIWHINADEPTFLGYRGSSPEPGPWRSSDHDPVWADFVWP